MDSQKDKKKDYKNILMNYKINESKNNKRKSDINRKKDYFHIEKLHFSFLLLNDYYFHIYLFSHY